MPLLLLLGKRHVLSAGDDGQVGGQEGVEAVLDDGQDLLGVAVVHVVEEDAADTTGLVSVLDKEVLVAPLLVARVEGGVVLVEGLLVHLVEEAGVVFVKIGGGEVGAAAEPPGLRSAVGVPGLEVAVVEVGGGGVRVGGVDDHAEAAGEELDAFRVGQAGGRVLGQLEVLVVVLHGGDGRGRELAVDDGDVDTALLEGGAVLQDHGGAAAAVVAAGPRIGRELDGVEGLEALGDLALLAADELFHLLTDGQVGGILWGGHCGRVWGLVACRGRRHGGGGRGARERLNAFQTGRLGLVCRTLCLENCTREVNNHEILGTARNERETVARAVYEGQDASRWSDAAGGRARLVYWARGAGSGRWAPSADTSGNHVRGPWTATSRAYT